MLLAGISGHHFFRPFQTVPLAEVTRQSWRLLDEFTVFSGLWMAMEEFLIFLRGLVDSDPEVVASLSLCGHARRQQRQWHAFCWFCCS